MKKIAITLCLFAVVFNFSACSMSGGRSMHEAEVERENAARNALNDLIAKTPGAAQLAQGADGILVFPEITKAGLLVGGQYGTGVLFKYGRVAGYYTSKAASYGLQAGIQKFGYALFFMDGKDMDYLYNSEGWEIGVGPSITIVDEGFAKSFTTTTARKGVYAFFFEQRGLMAGIGIQGTKITKTDALGKDV